MNDLSWKWAILDVLAFCLWTTHIAYADASWFLYLAGILIFPIGIINGFIIWLGMF